MQGTVVWRARLTSTILPKDETHFFMRGNMVALFYPISDTQFVWTVTAPVTRLKEVGIAPKAGPTGLNKANQDESHSHQGQRQQNGDDGQSQQQQQTGKGRLEQTHANHADMSASEVITCAVF